VAAVASPATDPRASIASLLGAHHDLLLRRARRFSMCADDADDALQRAAEILLAHLDRVDPERLVPWMLTVVGREAIAVRRLRLRALGDAGGDVAEAMARVPSESPGPAERFEHRERVARAARRLARLKPQERRALALQAEGHSYAEIQEITGWTYTKVNRCLAEGRARLRQLGAL
jgi:RNA polymerase sigma factor (sigma-70 family)